MTRLLIVGGSDAGIAAALRAREVDLSVEVTVTAPDAGQRVLGYDRLVVGAGATPVRPPLEGIDLLGLHVLHTMDDSFAVHELLARQPRSAVIIGATRMRLRVTGDRRDGRLLGAQILGSTHAQVAKRVDVSAAAIAARLTVDEVSDLDLSHTSPFSAPWDPVQAAAQRWQRVRGRSRPR